MPDNLDPIDAIANSKLPNAVIKPPKANASSDARIEKAVGQLKLIDADTTAWSCQNVKKLWVELFWKERLDYIAGEDNQRDRIESLHKQLDQFTTVLNRKNPVIEDLLRYLLAGPIAELLGDHGLQVLCPELGSRQPRLSVNDRPRSRRYEFVAVIEHEKIHRVVNDNLPIVLTRLIETIDAPLADFLQRPKGQGRRPNELRRVLIQDAAYIYTEATGQIPTVTRSEPFAVFCESFRLIGDGSVLYRRWTLSRFIDGAEQAAALG